MGVYDIIIVGAGPAGLSCALHADGKVLILDKERSPYRKIACAEWVPPDFDAPSVQKTRKMITEYPGGRAVTSFAGKVIDREKWQSELLGRLKCEVHLGEKVLWVRDDVVKTDRGFYRARWIVGADGPLSSVRRSFRGEKERFLPAVNVRLPLLKPMDETLIFFRDEFRGGYGWCFPRGETANVGVGMYGPIMQGLNLLIKVLLTRGLVEDRRLSFSAGLIPLFGLRSRISRNVILVGDAGGFTDPLTGAGIASAWDAGKLAARVANGDLSAEDYDKIIGRTYGGFLRRRYEKRVILEERWKDLKRAVEESWIAFSRA